jgi:hypothetical protein
MIIGLLTLAYLLFGRGHETFLLNPNLEKSVSVYVKDKQRKDEIDQVIKQVEKAEAAFQKKMKDVYAKKLVQLNLNRASTTADFIQEYNAFYGDLSTLQNSYVASELKIRTYMKPNEWDSIVSKALKQPDNVKARKSLTEENNKMHVHLLTTCNKYITDPTNKKKAKMLVDDFQLKVDTVASAFLDLNYHYLKAVRPYEVTAADFAPLRDKMIELRKSYSDYVVKMRFNLLVITPEKDWESLAKELNGVFSDVAVGL